MCILVNYSAFGPDTCPGKWESGAFLPKEHAGAVPATVGRIGTIWFHRRGPTGHMVTVREDGKAMRTTSLRTPPACIRQVRKPAEGSTRHQPPGLRGLWPSIPRYTRQDAAA